MTLPINANSNTAGLTGIFHGNALLRPANRQHATSDITVETQRQHLRTSEQAVARLEEERTRHTSFEHAPARRGQQAVAAYQSVQHDQRRAEVQSMLGVDLYA